MLRPLLDNSLPDLSAQITIHASIPKSLPDGSMSMWSKPCSGVSMKTRRRYARRRETAEHPFATVKMRMGATHFLMRRLPILAGTKWIFVSRSAR